jgi:hypothetical protein
MNIEKRHDELSAKIFQMGEALMKEGEQKDDYIITNVGNFMILISGLIYDEKDVHLFSELCGMFSAKKLVETQAELGPLGRMSEDELMRVINKLRDEISDSVDDDDSDDDE